MIAATGYVRAWRGSSVTSTSWTPAAGRCSTAPAARNAPGLYFTDFTNPISGVFRELTIDAEKIAKAVARRAEKARAAR